MTRLNYCSTHHLVEVWPDVWQPAGFMVRSHSNQVELHEASCPVCMKIARQSLNELCKNRQLIVLSTPAALL